MSEVKKRLTGEYAILKAKKPGREWRKLLKEFDNWHTTEEGGNIWRNAPRGLAGNDGLSKLVADMRQILTTEDQAQTPQISAKELADARSMSIEASRSRLKRQKRPNKKSPQAA